MTGKLLKTIEGKYRKRLKTISRQKKRKKKKEKMYYT